jgi:hypothetical protein
MWIVYQKKDREIVGMSACCEPELDKEVALAEVVNGLVGGGSVDKYDALQVKDSGRASTLISTPFRHLVIDESSKGKTQVSIEVPKMTFLQVSSDSGDLHPVDGIPEIKADGESFTTISVRKLDAQGEPQKARADNNELCLRTTAGTLMSADGREVVNRIKLKQGEAAFRLVSEPARRVAMVSVFNADPDLDNASIAIEFI